MRQAVGVLARAATRTPLRLVFFAAVTLACTWPLLSTAASLNSFRDEHPLVQYEDSARRTVVDYGEVPLWDPYYCGGLDGLGTPQSRFVSPTFLLTLAFGTIRAEAIVAFERALELAENAQERAFLQGHIDLCRQAPNN